MDPTDGIGQFLLIDLTGDVHVVGPALRRHLAGHNGRWELVPIPVNRLVFRPVDAAAASPSEYLAMMGRVRRAGDLADLATLIQGARWTGSLRVDADRFEKAVEFEYGDVTAVSSDAADDKLGKVLLDLGFVDSATLGQTLEGPDGRRHLGAKLVLAGKLTQRDLARALHQQIAQVFQSLLLLDEGYYSFQRTIGAPTRSTGLRVSTQQLLLTGLQKIDELKCFRQKIPGSRSVFEQVGKSDGLRLEDVERQVLEKLDGTRSLEDVARLLHLDEFEVTRAAFRLVQAAIIRLVDRPGGPGIADHEGRSAASILDAFNVIFMRLFSRYPGGGLREAAVSYMKTMTGQFGALFDGVYVRANGALEPVDFLANLERLPVEEQADIAYQGLTEYLFFITYAANEDLDMAVDKAFRRVDQALGLAPPGSSAGGKEGPTG